MSREEERYRNGEQTRSQVRKIIDRINDEKPSKESSRKVVTRADGRKVVRVVRKRRVSVSDKERKSKARRSVIIFVASIFSVILAFVGLFFIQLVLLSGDAYFKKNQEKLAETWGASSIEFQEPRIDGFSMGVRKLVAHFPANSMLLKVELEGVSAELDAMGIMRGGVEMETLEIARARIILRKGAQNMQMPVAAEHDLWLFKRVTCADFSVYVDDELESPISIENTKAYLYIPDESEAQPSVNFTGGKFVVKDWIKFDLVEGRARLTAAGVDDYLFDLKPAADQYAIIGDGEPKSIRLFGSIANSDEIFGEMSFSSNNLTLVDMTQGRLAPFFNASTRRVTKDGVIHSEAWMKVNKEGGAPSFGGILELKDAEWKSLPAMSVITQHLVSDKRARYLKLLLPLARVHADISDAGISLKFGEGEMEEDMLVQMQGEVALDELNNLSGNIAYGLPAHLTREEYTDGVSDPIFKEVGIIAWLHTELAGTANQPLDNSLDQEVAAKEARKKRSPRRDLNVINPDEYAKAFMEQRERERQERQKPKVESITPLQPLPGGESGGSSLIEPSINNPTDNEVMVPLI